MKKIILVSLMLSLISSLVLADDKEKAPEGNNSLSERVFVDYGAVDYNVKLVLKDAIKIEFPVESNNQKSVILYQDDKSKIMAEAFIEAKVPDCLHSEGLKRQFTFFIGGYMALPFVPIAWARGKCN